MIYSIDCGPTRNVSPNVITCATTVKCKYNTHLSLIELSILPLPFASAWHTQTGVIQQALHATTRNQQTSIHKQFHPYITGHKIHTHTHLQCIHSHHADNYYVSRIINMYTSACAVGVIEDFPVNVIWAIGTNTVHQLWPTMLAISSGWINGGRISWGWISSKCTKTHPTGDHENTNNDHLAVQMGDQSPLRHFVYFILLHNFIEYVATFIIWSFFYENMIGESKYT